MVGWERAYMPLAIGPALGILAMWRLQRLTAAPVARDRRPFDAL
jgi:hypothetical protein